MSAPAGAPPPDILLVVLDCVRAKSVPALGGEAGASTPVLARLSRRGTVFPRTVAPANWTIPSHTSIFTGVYPSTHGVRNFRRGAAPFETIASWLGRRGYDTALFTEMVHLVGGYGLEDGFRDRFARRAGISDEERTVVNRLAGHADILYSEPVRRLLERLPPFIAPMNALNHPQEVSFKRDVCSDRTLEEFDRWLAGRARDRPFFATVNLVDAHEPYPVVENGHRIGPLARWYARTPRYYLLAVAGLQELVPWEFLLAGYHRSIDEADRKVGLLLEGLARHGRAERTLVVVTADHGQSFGEGGNVFHGCGATESITRVPLLVVPPAEHSVPGRVSRWASLCELPSWFKSLSAGRAPFDEDGHAPFPFFAAAPEGPVVYCEGAPASDPNRSLRGVRTEQMWNHRLLAAYTDEGKFVHDLSTGALYRWVPRGDPDRTPPERLTRTEREETLERLFEPYARVDRERRGLAGGADENSTPLDRRLRSWGYG